MYNAEKRRKTGRASGGRVKDGILSPELISARDAHEKRLRRMEEAGKTRDTKGEKKDAVSAVKHKP